MLNKPIIDGTESFSGGINTVNDPAQLRPDELQSATNCSFDSTGSVFMRKGTKRTAASILRTPPTAANRKFGLGLWCDPVANKLIACVSDDNATAQPRTYVATPSTTFPYVWTEITGLSANYVAGSTRVRPSFASLNGYTYVFIGLSTGAPFNKTNDYVTWTNLTSVTPFIQKLEVYNSRLFGVTTSDRKLYYSGLNNGDSLGDTSLDGGAVDIDGAGKIVTLVASREWLYVFHEGSISAFSGWSSEDIAVNTGLRGVSFSLGITAPHTAIRAPDENVYFPATDGWFYRLTAAGEVQNLCQGRLPHGTSFGWTMAGCDPDRGEIVWINTSSVTLDGVSTSAIVYNYLSDSWSTWTFTGTSSTTPNALAFSTRVDVGRMFALSGDYFVRVFEGNTDDQTSAGVAGSALVGVATTKRFTFKRPWSTKAFRYVYLRHADDISAQDVIVTMNGASCSPDGTEDGATIQRFQTNTGNKTYAQVVISMTDSTKGVSAVQVVGTDYGVLR